MPQLDGTQILAMLSFVALVVAWLLAPAATPAAADEPLPAAA